jgi:hypothetical protein
LTLNAPGAVLDAQKQMPRFRGASSSCHSDFAGYFKLTRRQAT